MATQINPGAGVQVAVARAKFLNARERTYFTCDVPRCRRIRSSGARVKRKAVFYREWYMKVTPTHGRKIRKFLGNFA
jgi:hypothetical protein